ncbi:MAG: insulinase family protein [Clostridia bacterium]|nr:insulinase family protein [Clostridia bacterium]
MKKLIAMAMALMMVFGAVPGFGEAAAAEDGLPAAGEVIHGFAVKEIRDFPAAGAELVLFEHGKTGAKVMYIANDDTNRAFQLTFLTRPVDNTGLPHVFEHATLYGSDKYPSKTLLFNASYQTYNTYINATTMDAITSYPLASLSEEQLLRLADWYIDSCFHPNIMKDESIYKTQAWHYEMADADSPLTLEGTVYTEMVGAMTRDATALHNANEATFPGASLSYEYGGMPAHIPEMTWESLKGYHDRYYHPSNCFVLLYGALKNYGAFLELLDSEFSQYERKEFTEDEADYRRITEPKVSKIPYPTPAGTDTASQSTVMYYVVCPGMKGDTVAEQAIDHLCSLIGSQGSPLMQNLKKALPTGTFSVGREVAAPDDAVLFSASNVNEDDGEVFRQTIQDSLREIAEQNLDVTLVDAIMTQLRLSDKLTGEQASPVESIVRLMAYYYAVTGDPFAYPAMKDAYGNMEQEYREGQYTALINSWLLDPALYTLTTTYAAPGMKETEDAALEAKLAEIKAGMSEEEIAAIVAETNATPEEEDNSALMAKLKAVDVATLPEEIKTYTSRDETGEDGIRRIDVTAGVDGVGQVNLFFDAATLPQEDIHYMRLYTRLVGQMDTDAHTKEELSILMDRYLSSRTVGVQVDGGPTEADVQPWLVAQWTALDEDLEAGYGLMKELLTRTQFTDTKVLQERIAAQKAYVRSQMNGNPYLIPLYRGLGAGLMKYRYYAYLNFMDYYAFIESLEQKMETQPEEVIAGLERVQQFLLNRNGAIAAYAGSEAGIALNRPLADAFLAELPDEAREKAALNLAAPEMSEGVILDTNSGFNCLIGTFAGLGVTADAGMQVMAGLTADQILAPVLRDQMGVYTPWCGIHENDEGIYLITYRDPNVAETFEVYRKLPEMLEAMVVDQNTLDGYILSQYSSLAKPAGELTGAVKEISRLVAGKDAERTLKQMRELKQVTPDSIRIFAEMLRKLWESGYHATAAGAGTINANAEMYQNILNPFGAVDAGEVTLVDAGEDRADYAAIRFAYENGLMALKGDAMFAPDDGATAGELYAALYLLIGGGQNAEEEAMATFGQYGLVPEGVTGKTPLSLGLRDQIMSAFAAVTGMQIPAIGAGQEENVMTRGQLAQDLTMFDDGQ